MYVSLLHWKPPRVSTNLELLSVAMISESTNCPPELVGPLINNRMEEPKACKSYSFVWEELAFDQLD